ncbi:MAG: hypothetical protein J7L15_02590 [Clostridiales bacterium]|nr:hypothetical protein [Clostridiales bacterium]
MEDLTIKETVHGTFFYHLSRGANLLCGNTELTMSTNLKLETWGLETHLNERYCKKCDAIFSREKKKGI